MDEKNPLSQTVKLLLRFFFDLLSAGYISTSTLCQSKLETFEKILGGIDFDVIIYFTQATELFIKSTLMIYDVFAWSQ